MSEKLRAKDVTHVFHERKIIMKNQKRSEQWTQRASSAAIVWPTRTVFDSDHPHERLKKKISGLMETSSDIFISFPWFLLFDLARISSFSHPNFFTDAPFCAPPIWFRYCASAWYYLVLSSLGGMSRPDSLGGRVSSPMIQIYAGCHQEKCLVWIYITDTWRCFCHRHTLKEKITIVGMMLDGFHWRETDDGHTVRKQ